MNSSKKKAHIHACGAVYHTAWVNHMNDNGLGWPYEIRLDEDGLLLKLDRPYVEKWLSSVTVLSETVLGRYASSEHVEVDAILSLLGISVQLRFFRPATTTVRLVTR